MQVMSFHKNNMLKCYTVLQGKRAKLLNFYQYGHNFSLLSFQPTTLGM